MSVNLGLAQVSGDFLVAAIVIYSLAVIGFAGDFAFGRPRRAKAAGAAVASGERAAQLATVGAAQGAAQGASGGGVSEAPGAPGLADGAQAVPADAGSGGTGSGDAGSGDAALPARQVPALRAIWEAGPWVRAAVAFSALGILAHLVAVVTRGFAVHRAPWGNMYEFVTALTCVAAIFFCYVMVRYRAWALGVFVMGAVVVALGLAETVIYTAAGPLVPALQSYWLSIHVTAMTLATGIFFVAAVLGVMYLVVERYRARVAAGKAQPGNGLLGADPFGGATGQADLPDRGVRVPDLDVRRHRRRHLGGPGLGPLLGLGPGGDLGVHHLGAVRLLPARPRHRGLARPPRALHPAARLREPDVQHAGRPGLHHRHALLRRRRLTPGCGMRVAA